MKKQQLCWLLSVQILLLFSTIKNTLLVCGQCLNDQRSHLLHFKNGIRIGSELHTRFVQWNPKEDCCTWRGVGCDASGRVTTLELDHEAITGHEKNFTSLFRLQFLEKLNLGFNNFVDISIPKAIANLTNLVYLNLSNGFVGQIPIELASLRKLVVLDLSTYFPEENSLKLENPTLKMVVQNLTNIEEIYLDGVDLSAQKSEWLQVIAISLPKLRVLSLRKCSLSRPMNISLLSIHSFRNLSVIRLDRNKISAEIPESIANLPNLKTLSLASCNLMGQFPEKIFQVPTLQTIVILDNKLLHGSVPRFPKNSSLALINLHNTSFSGSLPKSIGNLHMLSILDMSICNFSGPVPQFQTSKNLLYIDLSHNSLTGSLSSAHFRGLQILETLDLGNNFLSGTLPSSIFKLSALRTLSLYDNQFSGQIDEISDRLSISLMRLETLELSSNQFNGSFPKFLFELKKLEWLSLSSNSFTDTIQLETFNNLAKLTRLELSHNNLTVEPHNYNSSLKELYVLGLASCKLQSFPEIKGLARLSQLDLSDNEITGDIPNWIWDMSVLMHVNLSFNGFRGFQKPYEISVSTLDLHSNQLQGEVPVPSTFSKYVDYSRNNFSGLIPSVIVLLVGSFLSIADNSLTGSIPDSICNSIDLQVLDLSNNALNGTIPSCLATSMASTLGVLNIAGNNLSGSIPDTFSANCSLKTLNLARNHLQGELPRTLSNCTLLEVLDIGYNRIEDVFPCMFENSSSLHVLILRSNKFYGELECFGYDYTWGQLQIIDIALNNFSGVLSYQFFSSLKSMLTLDFTEEPHRVDNLRFHVTDMNNIYYQFKVGVTMKGHEIELEKILTIFTAIDFSNNKFSGNIPESIGDLKLLYVLDLSHNEFTGGIPSSIEKLNNLESFDLSMNQLTGEIPPALKDLTFLSFLNLSFNILTGKIPTGSQLQTFSKDSYIGNVGLCGFPVHVSCGNANDTGSSFRNRHEIDWMYIVASVGYVVGLAIFTLFLLFCERWRLKLFLQVDRLLVKVFDPEWREPIRRL